LNSIVCNSSFYSFSNIPDCITVGFSDRSYNVGFDQKKESIKENRNIILSAAGISLEQLVCADQVHGDNVVVIQAQDKSKGSLKRSDAIPCCDAMVTKEKNLALAILTADCPSIFIADKEKGVIALAHAGWKSTRSSIVKKTVSIMKNKFGVNTKNILVYFGPAIRNCCYEVGDEFLDCFKRGIRRQSKRLFLDLIGVNQLQLEESGVSKDSIFDCGICTSCQNDIFFSYRKEGSSCGRQISVIVIKK